MAFGYQKPPLFFAARASRRPRKKVRCMRLAICDLETRSLRLDFRSVLPSGPWGATARVPHLDWLALPDHCFTAAGTAKRTQKQVCPHAPRSGAKCCGRNACREAQGGSPAR
eukprot:scaffold81392_cov43-Phaeocystis_antarctica.AAC.1